MQPLKLAISPCPNDTFAWEALVHQRLAGCPIQFSEVRLLDIQELNELARTGWADIVKVSFAAYATLRNDYQHLNAGAAFGRGVGPLLVHRASHAPPLEEATVAIPGWDTTAHRLLQHFAPQVGYKQVLRFDAILPAVQHGEVDYGVLIHEGRFTYPDYGLICQADLGQHWEQTTGRLIPLGGVIARRLLGTAQHAELAHWLRLSIRFAWENPYVVQPWVQQHAQEMAPEVQRQHIELYVNEYTEYLNEEAEDALAFFLDGLPAVAKT
jgi:1,4-dihydroxy-6-naphthoate synthase